jgi:phage regulator Rha-like protein
MTSLEIAEVTGKQHKDVLRAIRNMEDAWAVAAGRKFALSEYKDSTGRTLPCYSLTKTETLYVATKFNDEARARLVLRWEELEREKKVQGGVRRLLLSDADVLDESERIVGRVLDRDNAQSDGCTTTTDIARTLGMETRDLIAVLRDFGVLKARGRQRLTPEYEGLGLTEMRHYRFYSLQGELKEQVYLVWTEKGRELILRMTDNR